MTRWPADPNQDNRLRYCRLSYCTDAYCLTVHAPPGEHRTQSRPGVPGGARHAATRRRQLSRLAFATRMAVLRAQRLQYPPRVSRLPDWRLSRFWPWKPPERSLPVTWRLGSNGSSFRW